VLHPRMELRSRRLQRLCSVTLAALALGVAISGRAQSQAYPSRPVRIIVPYAQGGATDTLARLLAADLAAAFEQSFSVENRPGASGAVGLEGAARAPADGHTLVLINSTHASWRALGGETSVELLRDFVPVALLGHSPVLIAATPRIKAATLEGFIRLARAQPGALTYASCGVGTAGHVVGEMLKIAAGIEMLHVPYRGCAPAVQDALGGQVDLLITSATSGLAQIGPDRLRGLAVTSSRRLGSAPELPTVSELGYPEASIEVWHGLLTPANTPAEVIRRVQDETLRALRHEANRSRLMRVGIDASPGTGDEFGALLRIDVRRYQEVVERGRLKMH